MIFLFNAKISDAGLFKKFVRGIAKYPWKRAIIYYEADRPETLDTYIRKIFGETDLILRRQINRKQSDWIDTYELLNNGLVWLTSRYDHLFVDNNFKHLEEVVKFTEEGGCEKLSSIYVSDWPLALKKCVIIDHGKWNGFELPAPTQAWMTNRNCDSLQIITKELYKEWWMSSDLASIDLKSPEDLALAKKFVRPWKVHVPSREICRYVGDIKEENNFIDEQLDKTERKSRLLKYYFSHIRYNEYCLANPRVDKGIINKIMKHNGFPRKNK